MKTRMMVLAGALGALALGTAAPTTAQAAQLTYLGGCQNTDIIPSAAACYGFFQRNANGDSADMQAAQSTALNALGLTGPFVQLEHLEFSSGSTINFETALNGPTYISIHWGRGQGPSDTSGGATGFYRLDLGPNANLDVITSKWGSLSNAVLWSTDQGGFVPEPATWAMMIVGFGGVGALARRRRTASAAA